jgi:predicted metal-binding membrane protein
MPLALGWALMLVAMMAPLLTAPVRHVRDRSFARRRARAVALFVAGYGAIWSAAGAALLTVALAGRRSAPESSVPVALATLIALVWQFSPAKQSCLNRCHAHAELAAFAPAADLGALRFGLTHGIWCVGSCWALMLLPLLVSRGHLAAMAAVTLWILAERLERPMPPGWRWRGPGKAVRLVVAQSRLRLRART